MKYQAPVNKKFPRTHRVCVRVHDADHVLEVLPDHETAVAFADVLRSEMAPGAGVVWVGPHEPSDALVLAAEIIAYRKRVRAG